MKKTQPQKSAQGEPYRKIAEKAAMLRVELQYEAGDLADERVDLAVSALKDISDDMLELAIGLNRRQAERDLERETPLFATKPRVEIAPPTFDAENWASSLQVRDAEASVQLEGETHPVEPEPETEPTEKPRGGYDPTHPWFYRRGGTPPRFEDIIPNPDRVVDSVKLLLEEHAQPRFTKEIQLKRLDEQKKRHEADLAGVEDDYAALFERPEGQPLLGWEIIKARDEDDDRKFGFGPLMASDQTFSGLVTRVCYHKMIGEAVEQAIRIVEARPEHVVEKTAKKTRTKRAKVEKESRDIDIPLVNQSNIRFVREATQEATGQSFDPIASTEATKKGDGIPGLRKYTSRYKMSGQDGVLLWWIDAESEYQAFHMVKDETPENTYLFARMDLAEWNGLSEKQQASRYKCDGKTKSPALEDARETQSTDVDTRVEKTVENIKEIARIMEEREPGSSLDHAKVTALAQSASQPKAQDDWDRLSKWDVIGKNPHNNHEVWAARIVAADLQLAHRFAEELFGKAAARTWMYRITPRDTIFDKDIIQAGGFSGHGEDRRIQAAVWAGLDEWIFSMIAIPGENPDKEPPAKKRVGKTKATTEPVAQVGPTVALLARNHDGAMLYYVLTNDEVNALEQIAEVDAKRPASVMKAMKVESLEAITAEGLAKLPAWVKPLHVKPAPVEDEVPENPKWFDGMKLKRYVAFSKADDQPIYTLKATDSTSADGRLFDHIGRMFRGKIEEVTEEFYYGLPEEVEDLDPPAAVEIMEEVSVD